MTEEFDRFVEAGTCKDTLATFDNLCRTLGLQNTDKTQLFQQLSTKFTTWKIKSLMEKFKKRFSIKEYQEEKMCPNTRVLVIGAGPCGLRTAIEAAFLGCRVVLIEKRTSFTRNNVLHLWQFVVTDLKNLGAKHFYGKFCCGELNHICIKRLQLILLKVALILGVEVHIDVAFNGLVDPPQEQQKRSGWHCVSEPSDHVVSRYEFDVLVGATGRHALTDLNIYSIGGSLLKTVKGFDTAEVKNKLAIAISANFVNNNTDADLKVKELGGVFSNFKPDLFRNMKKELKIDLENLVYFKSDTHYFVMTAKKESLLAKGVFRRDCPKTDQLMSGGNVDSQALMNYAKEAANYCTKFGIPSLTFAKNKDGKPDVALIDFSTRYQSVNASRIIERHGCRLLIGLVGDSLLEPFWPSGTGCAKGFLGALDAAWMIKRWSNCSKTEPPLQILSERERIFSYLPQTTKDSLKKAYTDYTVDPRTRYQHLNLKTCRAEDARQYYTCDDEEYQEDTERGTDFDTLLNWCKKVLNGRFKFVHIENFTTSWRTGLGLCALIYTFRPELIDYQRLQPKRGSQNNQLAIDTAERELGISPSLSGREIAVCSSPKDDLVMSSYLYQFYNMFHNERLPPEDWSGYKETPKRTPVYRKNATSPVKEKKSPFTDQEEIGEGPAGDSSSNICYFCKKHLYIMERMNYGNFFFHRKCFRCHKCNCELTLKDCSVMKSSRRGVKFLCPQHSGKKLSRSGHKSFFRRAADKLKKSIRVLDVMKQTSTENVEAPEIIIPSRPDFLRSRVSKASKRIAFYNTSDDVSEGTKEKESGKASGISTPDKPTWRDSYITEKNNRMSTEVVSSDKNQDKKSEKDPGISTPDKPTWRQSYNTEKNTRMLTEVTSDKHQDKKSGKVSGISTPDKPTRKESYSRGETSSTETSADSAQKQRFQENSRPGITGQKKDQVDYPGKLVSDTSKPVSTDNLEKVMNKFDALEMFEDVKEISMTSTLKNLENVEEKQDTPSEELVEPKSSDTKGRESPELTVNLERESFTDSSSKEEERAVISPHVKEKPGKSVDSTKVQRHDRLESPIRGPKKPDRAKSPRRPLVKQEESKISERGRGSQDTLSASVPTSDDWVMVEPADDVSNKSSSMSMTQTDMEESKPRSPSAEDLEALISNKDTETVTELGGANLKKTLRRNVTIGEAKNIFEKFQTGPTQKPIPRGKRPVPVKAGGLGRRIGGGVILEETEDSENETEKAKEPVKIHRRETEKSDDTDIPDKGQRNPEVTPTGQGQVDQYSGDKPSEIPDTKTHSETDLDRWKRTSNYVTDSEDSGSSDSSDEEEKITEALEVNFGTTLPRNVSIKDAKIFCNILQKEKTFRPKRKLDPIKQNVRDEKNVDIAESGPANLKGIDIFNPNAAPGKVKTTRISGELANANLKKFEAATKVLDDEKMKMEKDNFRGKLWTTLYNPGRQSMDMGFAIGGKQEEFVAREPSPQRPKLVRSNSDEADIRKAQRVQLAARKLARSNEQQQASVAQEIKLQIEEAEIKLQEVEERGVEIEKALEDKTVDGRDKSNLMQELFTLTFRRNQLLQYESELIAVSLQLDETVRAENSLRSSQTKKVSKVDQRDSVQVGEGDKTEDKDEGDSDEDEDDDNIDDMVQESSDDDISELVPKEDEDIPLTFVPAQSEPDLWECAFCTLLNKDENDFCEACFSWRCRVCTLVNMNNKQRCDACGQIKPSRYSNRASVTPGKRESYA